MKNEKRKSKPYRCNMTYSLIDNDKRENYVVYCIMRFIALGVVSHIGKATAAAQSDVV